MLKRILLALSGTGSTPSAIEHAVELAARHGASIVGVTDLDYAALCDSGPVPLGAGRSAITLEAHRIRVAEGHASSAIALLERRSAEAGVAARVIRATGGPYESLFDQWRYADLTIADLQGLFSYDVLRRPDDLLIDLIRGGVRPMLAVAAEPRPIRRVLIAYNGSMESAKAMKRFVGMQLWPDPEVCVVWFDDDVATARIGLDAAVDYLAEHGIAAEGVHHPGEARQRLLAYADEWRADLLVLGATSRARIVRRLLGDTALATIRHATIPLFLCQ